MFENFVTFTEVVKLSSFVYHSLFEVNLPKDISLLLHKLDIDSFEQLVEYLGSSIDKINIEKITHSKMSKERRFLNCINKYNIHLSKHWNKILYLAIKFGDISTFGSYFHYYEETSFSYDLYFLDTPT